MSPQPMNELGKPLSGFPRKTNRASLTICRNRAKKWVLEALEYCEVYSSNLE